MTLTLPSSASGDVVAVVAGADDYEHVPKLGGAVFDAKDLAASFTWLGAWTTLLLERDVTRDNLLATFDDALDGAASDDVIIFSFAGHGIQVPDQDGDEIDAFDEAFVLPAFRPGQSDRQNLILDDDIERLVQRAAPRTVIFLADSCHSGTMLRGNDGRANFQGTRFVPRANFGPIPRHARGADRALADGEAMETAADPASGPPVPAPENLVFFGAVPEELAVQEVLIEGRPRGALSYAFARAVEGLADKDGDAILTAQELMMQVPEMVRVLSESRQTPRILTGARSLVPLFRLPIGTPAAAPTTAAGSAVASGQVVATAPMVQLQAPEPDTVLVRVAVSGSIWGASASTLNRLQGVEVAVNPEAADLILHEPSGDVLTNQGDVAARLGKAPRAPAAAGHRR